ncbi:hypothetical protein [Streptomyces sp. NPDC058335]|uniref:hypothetical protein n=1 Tax=Streptomyces sp. NPDC058335 TaxID=3346451 RepID=UPI0036523BBC
MPAAWSVSIKAAIAALTALWGVLAALTSARTAIAPTGVLPLVTPLPLATVRRDGASVTDGATETAEVP